MVFTANNGKSGLDKARRLMPDIIILDIIMPDMDGWTVYNKIKKIPLLSQVPIVIATIGEYEKMAKLIPENVDWSTLSEYEQQDFTAGSQELACSADGGCEIVDI